MENKNMSSEEFIITNWTDLYLEILLYQQGFENVGEALERIIDTALTKGKVVLSCLLSTTKIFNDEIIERFGPEYLFEGLKNCAGYYQPHFSKERIVYGSVIKKGCMKEKNRKICYEYLDRVNGETN